MMNIVIIDGNSLNPGDLEWSAFGQLGKYIVHGETDSSIAVERLKDADVVITNKFPIDELLLEQLPKLKCICITATGYNIIDVDAASKRNIIVCNASGYSTVSTAQHTMALLLALTNQCRQKHDAVVKGGWTRSGSWCYNPNPNIDLYQRTIGIVGLGAIGLQVAKLAQAFGMKTIGYKRSQQSGNIDGVQMVSLEQLYEVADVISLHCPLNPESERMINKHSLAKMKSTALLINASRGGLINEPDLKEALVKGEIAGAAVDVLSTEPPSMDNPLIHAPNCIITPHIAWGSRDCRNRLMQITLDNVKAFIDGHPQNVVN